MKTTGTFSVDKAALGKIQDILRRSGCADPVVEIYERADPGPMSDNMETAIRPGPKSEHDLREMAMEHYEAVKDHLCFSLAIRVSERSNYRPGDLIEVCGVTFAIPVSLVDALRDYCLTFEQEQFKFRSANNVLSNFRSLK